MLGNSNNQVTVIVNQYDKKTQTWQQLLVTITRWGLVLSFVWTLASWLTLNNNIFWEKSHSAMHCVCTRLEKWWSAPRSGCHAHDTSQIVCPKKSLPLWPSWVFGLNPSDRLGLDSESKYCYVSDWWIISFIICSVLIQTNHHWTGIGHKKSV